MDHVSPPIKPARVSLRTWIRRAFLTWAVLSTLWLANSFRTRDVDLKLLQSDAQVEVVSDGESLQFRPNSSAHAGLVFLCGSGVAPRAYVPMLRPIAEDGHPVVIVALPWRLAPLESHKVAALDRARRVMASHPEVSRWVLSGHSLGGALACRLVAERPPTVSALVLVGTTHPKLDDLSSLTIPVTKVYGSKDGVAPSDKIRANGRLLPDHTRWVLIDGGNHSQFGHYGHQLLDGAATISRAAQQEITRKAILEQLASSSSDAGPAE